MLPTGGTDPASRLLQLLALLQAGRPWAGPDLARRLAVSARTLRRDVGGEELTQMRDLGFRTWGNSAAGSTVMLTGTYQMHSETSQRLLKALPGLVVVPGDSWENPLTGYLTQEIAKDEPGQEVLLDRLLDLLLIAALRAWFSRPEAQAPGWYCAHSDPVVGPALRLLHHNPAQPWTVANAGGGDRCPPGSPGSPLQRPGR